MRKNIHKKSEARPIKNTPHKTTRNKKITKSKTQTKNSLHCDADEFYLTYIYMFICATTNKKNNTDNNNTHHSKFLSRATTHTFSQIIIFDMSDTQKPQNKSARIHVSFWNTPTHHILVILRTVFMSPSNHVNPHIVYFGAPALRIPVILCIVL